MNTISLYSLSNIVSIKCETLKLSLIDLEEKTGINRLLIGRLEKGEYLPSLPQLKKLADVLDFLNRRIS